MSDNFRYAYGDTNPILPAVDAAEVIEIGDLVWQDTDDVKPASDFTWTGGALAPTEQAFENEFLGVAMQRHLAADAAGSIRVATTGVFRFACAAATFELGTLVGPAKASGNALENQKVVTVTDPARGIGRVAKREATNVTEVLVEITSNVMYGGLAGNTAST